jgi:dTDP-4-amino-4,6-dideoxygalactose transaminase
MILCANPRAQYTAHKEEIDAALRRVLDKGRYILGEEVQQFESEFAAWLGVAHAVGVGSGTEALHLALAACGVGAGDEVITVSHTAVATVAAIELAGARPVFVDIDPASFTLDPALLAAAITPRTRAIVPVHLYGRPADLSPILQLAHARGLRVIEDCAQAHGALDQGRRIGSWGDAGCFSFYPTKNLGALGDGGAVVANSTEIATKVRLLREYGWKDRYVSALPGWNSRLDEIHAAILRVKLHHLDADNARRRALARLYGEGLPSDRLGLPKTDKGTDHVWHLYVVRCLQRDRLQAFLRDRGVGTLVHYPVPIHQQPAYRGRVPPHSPLPATEQAAREVLSLPLYPELGEGEAASVIATVREFFQS